MATITLKKMKLKEDNAIVKLIGECDGQEIISELSILQLAKVFGSDREAVSDVENDFGSEDYENKCDETRELVKKFPDIKFWNNKVEFTDEGVSGNDKDTLMIYAEEIVGWNNEGIRITFPKDLYDKLLLNKNFKVYMTPETIILKTEKQED